VLSARPFSLLLKYRFHLCSPTWPRFFNYNLNHSCINFSFFFLLFFLSFHFSFSCSSRFFTQLGIHQKPSTPEATEEGRKYFSLRIKRFNQSMENLSSALEQSESGTSLKEKKSIRSSPSILKRISSRLVPKSLFFFELLFLFWQLLTFLVPDR